jgi:hypothetical protein
VAPGEIIVQIQPSIEWPGAWFASDSISAGLEIGMLHLGPGCHGQLEHLMPYLAKGAIVLMEGYTPDGEAYNYAIDLAARGYLSSLVEARHWRGLGIASYLGGSK